MDTVITTNQEGVQAARSELLAVLSTLYSQTWSIYMLHPNAGICRTIEDDLSNAALDLWLTHKHDLFRTWRYCSCNREYPVPAPDGGCPVAYYVSGGDLWTGRQRMLRRDLLRHILAEL